MTIDEAKQTVGMLRRFVDSLRSAEANMLAWLQHAKETKDQIDKLQSELVIQRREIAYIIRATARKLARADEAIRRLEGPDAEWRPDVNATPDHDDDADDWKRGGES